MVCKRRLLGTYSLFSWFVSPGQLAGLIAFDANTAPVRQIEAAFFLFDTTCDCLTPPGPM